MTDNGYANRDQFFGLCKGERRYVETEPIPGLGRVRLRSLTAGERLACEAVKYTEMGRLDLTRLDEYWARVIVATVVDADGDQQFCEDDIPRLRQMDAPTHDVLTDEIQRLVLSARLDDVEAREKNFTVIPTG